MVPQACAWADVTEKAIYFYQFLGGQKNSAIILEIF